MSHILQPYDAQYVPSGFKLRNTGVMCYFNSLLQGLIGCSSFNKTMLELEPHFTEKKNNMALIYISLLKKTLAPAKPAEPEEVPSTDGITANGRACNDPRVEARPVGVVECNTSRRTLFSETVQPPAQTSERIVPRASNDPRGPKPEASAQAAGQS